MADESEINEFLEKFESLKKSIENGKVDEAEETISKIIQSQLLFNVKIEDSRGDEMKGFREEAVKRSKGNEGKLKVEEIDGVRNEAFRVLMELGVNEEDAYKLVEGVRSVKEAKERYRQSLMN